MRYCLTLFLLTLTSVVLADSVRMWQPIPILSTVPARPITAVTLGEEETIIMFSTHSSLNLQLSSLNSAYASDEDDRHYSLLRTAQTDSTLTLVFSALPQNTRLLDVVLDSTHRWMGVHSGIRNLRLPATHPQFNAEASVSDSIETILRANVLEDILTDDSTYTAMKRQLPLFRDYVAWKWKLTPHEVFLLQREHERLELLRNGQSAANTNHTEQTHDSVTNLPIRKHLPHGPKPPRPNLFQRIFRPRPISRFEQKMLQEIRK